MTAGGGGRAWVPESPDSPVLLKEEEGNARSIRGGRGSWWQR